MAEIQLRIEHLVLDSDNPRITHSEGQQQTLQKVVKDQRSKLVKLAESIVEHGLSPIERLMVLEVSTSPKRYIALEGNRRVAALKLLSNPAVMTGLDMPDGMQRAMERLASVFDKSNVEPLDGFEVKSREQGRYWIELRHNGENEGRGIVGWKPSVADRFRNKGPTSQAFDMVMEHGGFSEADAEATRSGFSLSTLKRLIDSPEVLAMIGLRVENGKLLTKLPGAEVLKPLKRMILDIAAKKDRIGNKIDSRRFNTKAAMIDYVGSLPDADRPDLAKKKGAERPIEGIETEEFAQPARVRTARRSSDPSSRKQVVPRGCPINVTDNRIAAIYRELRTLKLDEARNAIAVLMRVFLELSVDYFLEANGGNLSIPKQGGGERFKELDRKLAETVEMLVSKGVPKRHFDLVKRSLNVPTSPLRIDLQHAYVHSRFATPSPGELTAAWDQAQPLFEKIWP